ncbi:hypothetical protein EHI8A_109360 [Entamoeba histolytica HM-1:IMSS-B]|uniref:Uncharacterized protein n=6 Tax=Entamoeba histolytica TaxID=5759 RepID=C4M1Z6_ENTH1|nr:hypothetical protein EHI_165140 [Entamoeba histolytica HM-1:IMSS]EMD48474.1 Hypothetical protein EHI5A_145990 [Entamoeba histolytica KU27]EMH72687.1 hypothetical protein EHI8A_109360 [Entamoeba histolytica HM-1:IMSS-B]EMS12763.1 hypothetical protein KM1_097010 [Entamoeba histolytica HM-3:IMSS]ENY63849.1 hypothetical protein EHI7A_104110 [Entamoeba histolytica HM-1:IMSS-A]GAT95269.1 hypothetical protein CL6EHI_165140 [Entamoeba histolytica]|eukprot:XP_652225.1 hypothetical protein EHI_165140 [Entamoeba histolytica HM-1:IMSS]
MESEQWLDVPLTPNNTVNELIIVVSDKLRKKGITLTNVVCENNHFTIKQLMESGRLVCLEETIKNESRPETPSSCQTDNTKEINEQTSPIGSCHCCKTRKEIYFICEKNKYHRICERCMRKFSGVVVCPICNNICTCATCKRNAKKGRDC